MIIYARSQKSRKRKPNAKQRELNAAWQELIAKHTPKTKTYGEKLIIRQVPKLLCPPGRETPSYPSLNTHECNTYKKETMHYTGHKMKGIGTLHKSNAVPIFTDEEAQDQARMRR